MVGKDGTGKGRRTSKGLRPRLHGGVFKSFCFHFFAFSNRSTLDCVFKCLRFHDRFHRIRVTGAYE